MAFNLKNSVFFISTGKPAADNTGIISEESETEKQPEELALQAARIQSVSEQKKEAVALRKKCSSLFYIAGQAV